MKKPLVEERKKKRLATFFLQLVAFPQVVFRFTSMAAALSIEYHCCTMAKTSQSWSDLVSYFNLSIEHITCLLICTFDSDFRKVGQFASIEKSQALGTIFKCNELASHF